MVSARSKVFDIFEENFWLLFVKFGEFKDACAHFSVWDQPDIIQFKVIIGFRAKPVSEGNCAASALFVIDSHFERGDAFGHYEAS